MFYATDDGLPTAAESLLVALVLTSSSSASVDESTHAAWVKSIVALSGVATFSPSTWEEWAPPKSYTTGRANMNPLVTTGKIWLAAFKSETTKALCIAMTQQGFILSGASVRFYLHRLREPTGERSNKLALRTKGRPRLHFVLTAAAHFLNQTGKLSKVAALYGLALDSLPQRPPRSPPKAAVLALARRQRDKIEAKSAEVEALKEAHRLEIDRIREDHRAVLAELKKKLAAEVHKHDMLLRASRDRRERRRVSQRPRRRPPKPRRRPPRLSSRRRPYPSP